MESHPTKLVGSRGSKNRYFDFDKLEEVRFIVIIELHTILDVLYVFQYVLTLSLYD